MSKEILEKFIPKVSLALSASHQIILAKIYKTIINDNIIDVVVEDIAKMSEDNDVVNTLHNKWSEKYDADTVNIIDSIIFTLLQTPDQIDSLKAQYLEHIPLFENASAILSTYLSDNFLEPTLLDNLINELIENPANQKLKHDLRLSLNKANCLLSSLKLAAPLTESNITDIETLRKATEDYKEFQNNFEKCKRGEFIKKAPIDDFFYSTIGDISAQFLELDLPLRKSICKFEMLDLADQVIETIYMAGTEPIASKKMGLLYTARKIFMTLKEFEANCRSEFREINNFDILLYQTNLDKSNDLNNAINHAKELQTELLGSSTPDSSV